MDNIINFESLKNMIFEYDLIRSERVLVFLEGIMTSRKFNFQLVCYHENLYQSYLSALAFLIEFAGFDIYFDFITPSKNLSFDEYRELIKSKVSNQLDSDAMNLLSRVCHNNSNCE